jgi:hypothetical protein
MLHFKHKISSKEIAEIVNKTHLFVSKVIAIEQQTIDELKRQDFKEWHTQREEPKSL